MADVVAILSGRMAPAADEARCLLREASPDAFYPPRDLPVAPRFALDLLVASGEASWTCLGYVFRDGSLS